ncbi:pseudouridine synthase [Lapidilactobacillus concavus]|nr:pseudouridine synthase [Lapidilactobacillus concavus]
MKPTETMERLQKVIANAGVTSRRKAEELIATGRVSVNGQIVRELGTKVDQRAKIEVDGVPIDKKQKTMTFLFYKPRGVISAVSDDKHRKVITDYFADQDARLYPIGRLDYDTSGLILVTNDGQLANLMMHPKFKVDKTYLAKVEGIPNQAALTKLRQGVSIHSRKTASAKAWIENKNQAKNTALVGLTIHEGMNHQVKLMMRDVGYPVMKLKRDRVAFLDLTGLQPGEARRLSGEEVDRLYRLAQGKED